MGPRTIASVARAAPRLRRAYFDCRFGQLHTYLAIPSGGGFDEATALVCVAGTTGLGRWFEPLFPLLGRDRSIYAPDLPGCGLSDGPAPAPANAAAAAIVVADALADLCRDLGLRAVDFLALDAGGAAALALARRPQAPVRRLALLRGEASADLDPVGVPQVHTFDLATAVPTDEALVALAPSVRAWLDAATG